jgi:formamidopyrimidine-DNA glycosylase
MPEIPEVCRMTNWVREQLMFTSSNKFKDYLINTKQLIKKEKEKESKNDNDNNNPTPQSPLIQLFSIKIPKDSNLLYKDYELFMTKLPLKIKNIFSFAKKMLIQFEDDSILLFEFGMTGNFDKGAIRFSMNFQIQILDNNDNNNIIMKNKQINYKNDRKIRSIITYYPSEHLYLQYISKFAPDCSLIDYSTFLKRFQVLQITKNRQNTVMFKLLLDQYLLVSGIGNYLRAEILYDAELNPYSQCKDLTELQIERLFKSIKKIITQSYNQGGLTIKDFHVGNTRGKFKPKVYNRTITLDDHKLLIERLDENYGFKPTLWWVPGNDEIILNE